MNTKQNIPFSPPDIGEDEINEVIDSLRSGWITTGPKTKKFEEELSKFCGTDKTVCLNSDTAALELSLRVLDIGPGDEVIVPAYTYTASCSVICHVGATPIMVDIQKDNLEMDYEKFADAITENTKAVIPVDLGGVLCDYDKIHKVIEEKREKFKANSENEIQKFLNRIAIIEDGAHSLGAIKDGKRAGNFADFTCFSFHAVKNLTTAEGGAVTWKDFDGIDSEKIYKKFQILSLHGQTKDALHKNQIGAWEYDILEPAFKCNMTDINAAIGLAQLRRYEELLDKRHKFIKIYENALKNHNVITLEHENEENDSRSSGHLFIVHINNIEENTRNEIIMKMAERGIATNVHYKPLPMLTAYKNLGFDINNYPNAYNFYKGEITLPLYTKLDENQVKYIIENFVGILEEYDI